MGALRRAPTGTCRTQFVITIHCYHLYCYIYSRYILHIFTEYSKNTRQDISEYIGIYILDPEYIQNTVRNMYSAVYPACICAYIPHVFLARLYSHCIHVVFTLYLGYIPEYRQVYSRCACRCIITLLHIYCQVYIYLNIRKYTCNIL
jgi:hypothetical protein